MEFTAIGEMKVRILVFNTGFYKIYSTLNYKYSDICFSWLSVSLTHWENYWKVTMCRELFQAFPGGAVVKNLPANAGDMGSSPGPGRSHMPRSNWACAPQLLHQHSRAREPQLLSPRATTTEACVPRTRAPQQEKPLQWEACAPQGRAAPAHHN